MANSQAEGRFILDTPGSTIVSPLSYYVKQIRVVSTATSPSNHTVLTDKNGIVRWEWYGDVVQSVEKWWFDGFKLVVLDGGLVYLDVK